METTNIAKPLQKAVGLALRRDQTLAEFGIETHDLVMSFWVCTCRPYVIVAFLWVVENHICIFLRVSLPEL